MSDLIKDFWGVFVALAGGVVWLARLESKGLANEREIKRLWETRRDDLDAAKEQRQEFKDMLTEIRLDVKTLLKSEEHK